MWKSGSAGPHLLRYCVWIQDVLGMRNVNFLKLSKVFLVFWTPVSLWGSSRAQRDMRMARIPPPAAHGGADLACGRGLAWGRHVFQGGQHASCSQLPRGLHVATVGSRDSSVECVSIYVTRCTQALCPLQVSLSVECDDISDVCETRCVLGCPLCDHGPQDASHCDSRKKHIVQSGDISPDNVPNELKI